MFRWMLLGFVLAGMPVMAQEGARFAMGADVYLAGNAPVFAGAAGTVDLFMAGQRVSVAAPVLGAVHLVGRRVEVRAAIGGDLFAAGYGVAVEAPVAGDATVSGVEVAVLQGVGGNLRAAGAEMTLAGNVGGYALLSAGDLALNGVVAGDVVLSVDGVTFGPEARVGGNLTIYASDPDKVMVPESVAPAARVRIERRSAAAAPGWEDVNPVRVSFWVLVQGMLVGVVLTGLVALLVIALAPQRVQVWRKVAGAHPWWAMFSGFLVASALAGCGIVLAMTIVGALLIPVMMVVVPVAVFAGYALGAYVLGSALWQGLGRVMPEGLAGKFGLALLGAAVVALGWFVPVLGWFFALGVTLMGLGTLAAMILPENLLLNRGHVAQVAGG